MALDQTFLLTVVVDFTAQLTPSLSCSSAIFVLLLLLLLLLLGVVFVVVVLLCFLWTRNLMTFVFGDFFCFFLWTLWFDASIFLFFFILLFSFICF